MVDFFTWSVGGLTKTPPKGFSRIERMKEHDALESMMFRISRGV